MNNKILPIALYVLTVVTLISCSDNIVPGFTYSPEAPKRGHKVTFTNTTTADEEDWKADNWEWDFGDGSTSTSESPVHTYKKSGKYNVVLKVNKKDNLKRTETLTVYDSVPTIYLKDVDAVEYYKNATFSVLAYNPYSEDVTYKWTFSGNAVSSDLDEKHQSTSKELKVYFTKRNVYETVKLHIEIGDSIYDVDSTFYVHDIKARSVVFAQKDGNLLRQRIVENNGLEDYTNLNIASGKHPLSLQTYANKLYVFDAGSSVAYKSNWLTDTSGDGKISVIDMGNNNANTTLITNNGTSSHFGFYNGHVDNDYIYWTDYSEFVYRTPRSTQALGTFQWKGSTDAQTAVPYYLVKTDRLGYYGNGLAQNQLSGGFYNYDEAYFWAKGGSGKGLYRFLPTDILTANTTGSTPVPTLGAILTDYSIRAFTIDEINQKIYFSVTAPASKVGLWVANLTGTGATRIDDAPMDDASLYITGIAVDNISNKVYWAYRSPETIGASAPAGSWTEYYKNNPTHRTGIKMAALATAYKSAGTIEYFRLGVSAYGLALDETGK
jgi:PKD repeat protein